jgi:endonuclease YncB( thermonuclease family)
MEHRMRQLQFCGIALLGLNLLWAAPAFSQPALMGRASIIDGDTIEIHGERVRLNGVDAPETAQRCKDEKGRAYRCGTVSAAALEKFLAASRPTRCEFVERDRYGRFVGECYRADGTSVSAYLVRNGFALDYLKYSHGKYASEEAKAKREKAGMWRGEFTPPWEWRAEQRSKGEITGSLPSRGCTIKGNITRKGARIYHRPGQRDYERTRITESKGERWFCSEDEAQAAGWKPAHR